MVRKTKNWEEFHTCNPGCSTSPWQLLKWLQLPASQHLQKVVFVTTQKVYNPSHFQRLQRNFVAFLKPCYKYMSTRLNQHVFWRPGIHPSHYSCKCVFIWAKHFQHATQSQVRHSSKPSLPTTLPQLHSC